MTEKSIEINFDEYLELENSFKAAHEIPKWERNSTPPEVGSHVSFLGYVFKVVEEIDDNKFRPTNSYKFAMIPASAGRNLCELFHMENLIVKVTRDQVYITIKEFEGQDGFNYLAYGATNYGRSNLLGVSNESIVPAIRGFINHKDEL